MFQKYKQYLPLLLFHLIFLAILIPNFHPDKWFLGWDAVNPELNFPVNVQRALFAFWQENYGLGLLGGHGFAATLPHTLIIWFLSIFLPSYLLRTIFTFLCLYLGGLGMYVLVKNLLLETHHITHEHKSHFAKILTTHLKDLDPVTLSYIATAAAVFYMLNLGTVQIFYVQLEAFIVQFAALPWLFWSILRALEKPSYKKFLLFFLINFLASIQGFIPVLFVAYAIGLCSFLAVYVLSNKSSLLVLKNSFLILLITGITNIYWLIPLLYFQLTRSNVFLSAYNNLTTTQHFIELNKKYGDLLNVSQLKGFLFDSFELGGPLLGDWVPHQQNGFITLIGIATFLIIVLGVIGSFLVIRSWKIKAFALVFLFFFISIATNAFPFSLITEALQHVSPIYQQAFRTAFTKFSIGVSFSYSLFLGFGLSMLLAVLFSVTRQKVLTTVMTVSLFFVLFFLYAAPAFTGHFLYNKLFTTPPKPYQDIISYFKTQPDGRIADLPQDCPEGWFAYNWGYFGSGFYWYGIKQPILSRTFDVWSNYNENYFWEVTQALREQDFERVDTIFQKYNVTWVLYDPNLLYCRNQRPFLIHEAFTTYLEKSNRYKLVKTFIGDKRIPIKLYKSENQTPHNFVRLLNNLPNIGSAYTWTDNDTGYRTYGDYKTDPSLFYTIYYPFRSLFTKREYQDRDFEIQTTDNDIIFKRDLSLLGSYILPFPQITTVEKGIPVEITITPLGTTTTVTTTLLFPQVFLNNQKLTAYNNTERLAVLPASVKPPFVLTLNGDRLPLIVDKKTQTAKATTMLYFTIPNTLEVSDSTNRNLLKWTDIEDPTYLSLLSQTPTVLLPKNPTGTLSLHMAKVPDKKINGVVLENMFDHVSPKPCGTSAQTGPASYEVGKEKNKQYIRITATNNTLCTVFDVPTILTSFGHIAEVTARNINGNPLLFSIQNKNRIIFNDLTLPKDDRFTSYAFVIPPAFPTELGYSVFLDTISEDYDETTNDIQRVALWTFPYAFTKSLALQLADTPTITKSQESTTAFSVFHPNDTRYEINLHSFDTTQNTTLVLSQTYDAAWQAFVLPKNGALEKLLPFVFGQKLKNPILINNWAMGWDLETEAMPSNTTIIILYLPQYAQTIVYIFFILALILLILLSFFKKSSQ